MEHTMALGVNAVMLPEMDFEAQVALCASLGVRYYQYRPRVIPADAVGKPFSYWGNHRFDLTPKRLLAEGAALTRKLADAGLAPWGTVPDASIDEPDSVIRLHLEAAAAAGAGRVRLGPTGIPDAPFDYRALLARVVRRYTEIIETMARPLGIRIIVETHAQSLASGPALAWNIVQSLPPADIGVIFDIANFAREGAVNPRLAVSVLREYIDCIHIGASRRVTTGIDEKGLRKIAFQFCSFEEGDLPVRDWVAALAEAGVTAPYIIEDYATDLDGPGRLRRAAKTLTSL
jgi:sugar phosphate isomerase/epimerase